MCDTGKKPNWRHVTHIALSSDAKSVLQREHLWKRGEFLIYSWGFIAYS